MGSTAQPRRGPVPFPTQVQEIKQAAITTAACNTLRAPPAPTSFFGKAWATVFSTPIITAASICTQSASAVPNGVCLQDAGDPLVARGTATDGSGDVLYGISAEQTEQCDSSVDPNVFSNVANADVNSWITDTMKRVTPVWDGTNLISNPASTPKAAVGASTTYGYSLKVTFAYKAAQGTVAAGGGILCAGAAPRDDQVIGIKYYASPITPWWSREFVQKKYYDADTKTAYALNKGGAVKMANPFGVDTIGCQAGGTLKMEWSSSKNFTTTQTATNAAFTYYAGDWTRGILYWANKMRCAVNVGGATQNNIQVTSFKITSGKGTTAQKTMGPYTLTAAQYANPPDCSDIFIDF